jgi:hypothetical protein
MKDLDKILYRLAELERLQRNARRPATVEEVGKDDRVGQYKLNLGKKADGSVWKSPWIKAGNHQGMVNEHVPFEKGQNVWVNQHGGDFHHSEITPYTDSEYDPMPKDAKPNKHTYRIRKPPEEKQDQSNTKSAGSGGAGASSAGQQQEREKQKDDDENDFIFRNDYEGRYTKKGKATHLFGKPEKQQDQSGGSGTQAQGGQSKAATQGASKDPEGDKERHHLKVGNAEILIVEGKIVFKVGKSTYTMTDGKIEQTAGTQKWTWTGERTDVTEGGVIAHDKQGIGKGHKHKDVTPGGSNTGDPIPQ